VAQQKYSYRSSGETHAGENAYSILHAPRGDATEAIVLVAALWNNDGEFNEGGVALVLALAQYFKRTKTLCDALANTSRMVSMVQGHHFPCDNRCESRHAGLGGCLS
jgi:hypothetical protein